MVILQDIVYKHPDKDLLFDGLTLTINRYDKIALIGNNGVGKSTLLKIVAGEIHPFSGRVNVESRPYYLPQLYGAAGSGSIAGALGVEAKLLALRDILNGDVTEEKLVLLDNDWTLEERCGEALGFWGLADLDPMRGMATLSGGQKTKVLLAGIAVHNAEIILMDEPSNHLDKAGRNVLYDYIESTRETLMVVSHDRTLLNRLNMVYELTKRGISVYGGNYDFYVEQKQIETAALNQDLKSKEKALRKAKEIEREAVERKQKLDSRGKKKQEKAGLPTIVMNGLKNSAERSTSRLKGIHGEKIAALAEELSDLRRERPEPGRMKMNLDDAMLHKGKVLVTADNLNYSYNDQLLWKEGISFQITSGERIALEGSNGSGKTTLLKLILGELQTNRGTLEVAPVRIIYMDQDYSSIDNRLNVYEQALRFNTGGLQEHEIKIRLNRFLFTKADWNKPCEALSGGERMRLMICSLTIANQAPDLIVLDEPTNNLDIRNIEILTEAVNEYNGTVLVVTHDTGFLDQIGASRSIRLE